MVGIYYYYIYNSPVGKLTIASNEKNVVGLWLDGQKYYMEVLEDKEYQEKETEVIKLCHKVSWIVFSKFVF